MSAADAYGNPHGGACLAGWCDTCLDEDCRHMCHEVALTTQHHMRAQLDAKSAAERCPTCGDTTNHNPSHPAEVGTVDPDLPFVMSDVAQYLAYGGRA